MGKVLIDKIFGQNLQKIRYSRGLSQDETIGKMAILGSPLSRSTYSLIELGRGNIFVSDLVALQKIFEVDYAEFFKGISTSR